MKYRVTDTHIKRNGTLYAPGDIMELTEKEAEGLHVELVPAEPEKPTVKEIEKSIRAAATIADVEALVKGDDRNAVTKAAQKKIKAIEESLLKEAIKVDPKKIGKMEGDELIQHLMNRKINPPDNATVPELAKLLREALELEGK